MTDEGHHYMPIGCEFASHEAVNHGEKEYVRGDVTTIIVEGYYSIFTRGIISIAPSRIYIAILPSSISDIQTRSSLDLMMLRGQSALLLGSKARGSHIKRPSTSIG